MARFLGDTSFTAFSFSSVFFSRKNTLQIFFTAVSPLLMHFCRIVYQSIGILKSNSFDWVVLLDVNLHKAFRPGHFNPTVREIATRGSGEFLGVPGFGLLAFPPNGFSPPRTKRVPRAIGRRKDTYWAHSTTDTRGAIGMCEQQPPRQSLLVSLSQILSSPFSPL